MSFIQNNRFFVTLLFLIALPFLVPYEALALNILILGLYALGFNLIFGYTGLLSFGHGALLGAGSYGCGMVIVHLGWHPLIALVLGIMLASVMAYMMGRLAIRAKGIYFAMVTMALSMCFYYLFYQLEKYTGGENGLRGINVTWLFGFSLHKPLTKYYIFLVPVALAIWFFSRLLNSPFGAVLEAIRENEKRAQACGFDVERTKLLAFVLSGAFCGLAGGLKAIHLSTVPIETMHYITSGQVVMMALLGGMNTFFGPFVGAMAFILIEDILSSLTRHWQLFLGIIFIIFVLFFRRGIWGEVLAVLEKRNAK